MELKCFQSSNNIEIQSIEPKWDGTHSKVQFDTTFAVIMVILFGLRFK